MDVKINNYLFALFLLLIYKRMIFSCLYVTIQIPV